MRIMTIRLKILICAHLQVVNHHGGPPASGLRTETLPDALGDLGYRFGQRPAHYDVHLHLVRVDHDAGDLLGAFVGRGLDEPAAAHGVDPFCGEGRHGGGPRELYLFCHVLPGSSSGLFWSPTGPAAVPGPPARAAAARVGADALAPPPAAGRRCSAR